MKYVKGSIGIHAEGINLFRVLENMGYESEEILFHQEARKRRVEKLNEWVERNTCSDCHKRKGGCICEEKS